MLTWIRQHFGQFVIANGGIRGSGFRLASIANGRIRGLGFYSKTVRGIDSSILDKNLEYPVLLVVVLRFTWGDQHLWLNTSTSFKAKDNFISID